MNYSRTSSAVRFILLLLAIALVVTVAVCGIFNGKKGEYIISPVFEEGTIRLGLDLAGGSVITYQAQTDDTGDKLKSGMDSVVTVLRDRLDNQGLTEALCYTVGDDMVTIEIPDVDDPNEAIAEFMQTAKLTFRDPQGTILLDGSDVDNASAGWTQADDGTQEYCVNLELTGTGAVKFAEATKKAAQNGTTIDIYMDDKLLSNPKVDSKFAAEGITGGKAVITGNFDAESAQHLANNINAGALKYDLEVVEQRTVGATLGKNSLSTSLIAGAIGLLLVVIFMCIYYKVPGIMASIALVAYTGLFGLVLTISQANLTLAGIAGIVLSIGMAVDANVVIFERMKEELAMGKSVKAAIKGGFHRAFAAVLDSNVTTLIACGVLYFLGSGTIKGFATTLFIGVILSLITALLITRALLYLAVGMGISNVKAYTPLKIGKGGKRRFHFIKNKKVTVIIVALVIVIGAASFIIRQFNIDIDFSGGTEIQIDLGTEVTDEVCDNINKIIENNEKLGKNYVSSTTQSTSDPYIAIIRTGTAALTTEQEMALEDDLVKAYENADTDNIQITTIAATIGNSLTKKAFLAVGIAVLLMLIYIWIRFELSSGIAAVVCLMHDLFVMLTVYSVLQIPINSNIIAAFLTILGYSINATIIVFDRIRENREKDDGKEFGEVVNDGVHDTLARSINTTLTTLFTIGMIFILGVSSIRDFAFPLIVGIIAGLFSSVCISGMLWNALSKVIKPKAKKAKEESK